MFFFWIILAQQIEMSFEDSIELLHRSRTYSFVTLFGCNGKNVTLINHINDNIRKAEEKRGSDMEKLNEKEKVMLCISLISLKELIKIRNIITINFGKKFKSSQI